LICVKEQWAAACGHGRQSVEERPPFGASSQFDVAGPDSKEHQMTKKIVCAVDDSEHTKTTVGLAAEIAKATGAELTLLAVNELSAGSKGGAVAYLWDNAELNRVLESAATEAKKAGAASAKTASIKSRDVARAIAMYAEDNGADHIVVGTGGKGSVSRLMLGSVSRDVVFRAHCPVTVAR
jgi:nucleotide-binding universal stress UspA family protein